MSNPKQPSRPKSTDDILREMEAMSQGGESASEPKEESGGALKSLLGLFVKVHDDEPSPPPTGKPAAPMPAAAPPAARPPQPGPRVADLVANDPAPKFAPQPTASATGSDPAARPFDEIYRMASLPASPCSVDDLATLLENPTIASQPMNVKVVAVNLALSAKNLTIEAPVTDAVRRDRALDAYQAMLNERAAQTEQRNNARVQQISQEVEEYLKRKQAEMDALRAEVTEAKKQSIEFSVRREAEEKRLAELITPFLEGRPNPVTIGNQPEPIDITKAK